jgi:hypothetical protein
VSRQSPPQSPPAAQLASNGLPDGAAVEVFIIGRCLGCQVPSTQQTAICKPWPCNEPGTMAYAAPVRRFAPAGTTLAEFISTDDRRTKVTKSKVTARPILKGGPGTFLYGGCLHLSEVALTQDDPRAPSHHDRYRRIHESSRAGRHFHRPHRHGSIRDGSGSFILRSEACNVQPRQRIAPQQPPGSALVEGNFI